MADHSSLTGANLHLSKIRVGTGSPNTTLLAATYVGDVYLDDATNSLWIRKTNAGASTDWVPAPVLQQGDDSITFITSASTTLTLPTTGTLATLAGAETLTNKTIVASSNTITEIADANVAAAAAIAGTKLANTPSGNLSAITVQAALNELQTELDGAATSSALSAHISDTTTHGTTGDIVGTSDAQVLTNKDIDGGTASNTNRVTVPKDTLASLLALTRKAGTIVYATDVGSNYYDDGTTLKQFGSGASGRNYLSDWYDAEKPLGTLQTLTASGDRTSNTTSWGITSTGTFAANTSSPLRGSQDYKFTPTGASEFIESPMFTLDAADVGKPVYTKLTVNNAGVSADFDLVVVRYNSSGTFQEVLTTGGVLPTGTAAYQGFFLSSSTATDQYALRLRRTTAGVTAIQIDDILSGPQATITGQAISDWQTLDYTTKTNIPFTTATVTPKYVWKRVGDSLEIMFEGQLAIDTTTTAEAYIDLPDGLAIDATKILTAIPGNDTTLRRGTRVGFATTSDSGNGTAVAGLGVFIKNGSTTRLVLHTAIFGAAEAQVNQVTTSYIRQFHLSVMQLPIANWSSNITLADRALESFVFNVSTSTTASDTSSFGDGAGGAQIQNITSALTRRIRFPTPNQPTDSFFIEIKASGSSQWLPTDSRDSSSNAIGFSYIYQNGVSYGLGQLIPVSGSTTDMDVAFGQYAFPTSTYGAAGQAWGAGSPAAGAAFWRVRRVSGGALVGHPIGARNVVGDTTGTTVPTGFIGESITTTSTTAWQASNQNLLTHTFKPGVWIAYIHCFADADGSGRNMDISFTSTTAGVGSLATGTRTIGVYDTANQYGCVQLNGIVVNVAVDTPYYLAGLLSTVAGLSDSNHRLTVVRIG